MVMCTNASTFLFNIEDWQFFSSTAFGCRSYFSISGCSLVSASRFFWVLGFRQGHNRVLIWLWIHTNAAKPCAKCPHESSVNGFGKTSFSFESCVSEYWVCASMSCYTLDDRPNVTALQYVDESKQCLLMNFNAFKSPAGGVWEL